MYQVRRVNIGKTAQLDELARECGRLYSQTVTSFWRTVRKKGVWLKPKHLMRWHTSNKLHAHTADACVQAFFASLKSWRARRKTDPDAHPPRRRRWYFRIEYKSTALRLKDGKLTFSNGKGNAPLLLDWPWELPKTVVIRWTGTQYEAVATYQVEVQASPSGSKIAGIDLGEIHLAVAHDGTQTHLVNGRLLRSKRQYQNKLKEHLSKKIDRKKKGSRRRKKLIRSKQRQLRKLNNQIKDIEHKQTTRLISTLHQHGVQTVVIGDVRECAASALIRLLPRSRRSRTSNLLGQPTYLASKDKGENSMLVKRISPKVCKVMLRKSCTHGEAEFVEPKFPVM